MPKQKDLKRRVRARMRKTGESYAAARSKVVGSQAVPPEDYARVAGISDESVRTKTGRTWAEWVRALDAKEARRMPHRDIARLLQDEWDVPLWWAQSVTVAYERIRGLRDVGQRREGAYDVNKSKTLPVPIGALYEAFGARKRRVWAEDATLTVRKANREKSIRFVDAEGRPVNVHFWEKGPEKSQVTLQHGGLPSKAEAARARELWTRRLAALTAMLRG